MSSQEEIKFKISDLTPISSSDIDKNDLLLVTDVSEVDKSKLSKSLSIEKLSNYINNKTPVVTVDLLLSTGVHIADIIANNIRYPLYTPQSTYTGGTGISINDSTGEISINPEVLNEINTIESNLNIVNTNLSNSISTLRSDIYRDMKAETSKLDVDTYEGIGKFITSVTQSDGLISVKKGIIEIDDLPELNIDNINNLTTRLNSLDSSVININNTISNYVFKSNPSNSNKILTELDISSFTSGVNYLGESTSEITDGGIESPTIDSYTIDPNKGYVVKYNNDLFIFHDNKWINLTKDVVRKGEIVNSDISESANISISKISGLSSKLGDLTTTVGDHTTSLNNLSSDVSELTTTVGDHTTSLNNLSSDVSELTTTVSDNTTSLNNLSSDVSELTTTVSDNTTSLNNLSSDISELTTTVGDHTTSLNRLSDLITNLNSPSQSDNNGYIDYGSDSIKVYQLPKASNSSLGGVIIGSGLKIDDSGVLSNLLSKLEIDDEVTDGNAISEITITDEGKLKIEKSWFLTSDHTFNIANRYQTGMLSSDDYIRFDDAANTSRVSKSNVNGNISLNGESDITVYSLPVASSTVLGGIRLSDQFITDGSDLLYVNEVNNNKSGLMTSLDKIKLDNISEDANHVSNSDNNGSILIDNVEYSIYNLPIATNEVLGGVKVGSGLLVDNDGLLSLSLIGSDSINIIDGSVSLKLNSNDNILYLNDEGLSSELNLVYDRLTGIKLLGRNGIQIGDTIDPSDFITNGLLYSVELVNDPIGYDQGNYIKLGFNVNDLDSSSSGDDIIYIYININDLIRVYNNGDSIEIRSDSSINVKLNPNGKLVSNSNGLSIDNDLLNQINNNEISINTKLNGIDNSTENHVLIFGSNGYTVKDSGFTIGKSVPSDAKFSDTTYELATESINGLMSSSDKYKLNRLDIDDLLNKINSLTYELNLMKSRFYSLSYSNADRRYSQLIISTSKNEDNVYETNKVSIDSDTIKVDFVVNDGNNSLNPDEYLYYQDEEIGLELPDIVLYIKNELDSDYIRYENIIIPYKETYIDENGDNFNFITLHINDYSLFVPNSEFYMTFSKLNSNSNNVKFFMQETYYNS